MLVRFGYTLFRCRQMTNSLACAVVASRASPAMAPQVSIQISTSRIETQGHGNTGGLVDQPRQEILREARPSPNVCLFSRTEIE